MPVVCGFLSVVVSPSWQQRQGALTHSSFHSDSISSLFRYMVSLGLVTGVNCFMLFVLVEGFHVLSMKVSIGNVWLFFIE